MKIKYRVFHVLLGLILLAGLGLTPGVSAQGGGIRLVPGTTSVGPEIEAAILQSLTDATSILPATEGYAITNVHQVDNWSFISMVGLMGLGPDLTWSLEKNSVWMGLTLLRQDEDGHWAGAVSGTTEFSRLIETVPDNILSQQAKQDLDPLGRISIASTPYLRFPWPSGAKMQYGISAVHNAGFAGYPGMSGWKAVDFFSDGNAGVGNADRLIVAEAGTIAWVCNDGTSVAVRVGDLLYAHLLYNGNLTTGRYFNRGDDLGVPKKGNFSANCGYASQNANWFHVHLGFPDSGTTQFENWTLNLSDGLWRRNTETLGTLSWFYSDTTPPATTATPSGTAGEAGWYRSDVAVTFSATDNSGGTGVNHIEYRVDGGSWQSGSAVTLSTAGNHTVGYRAQDNAGNWESEKQLPVKIDKTAPTGSVVINNNALVSYASLVYLNSTANDALSGVSQMRFRDSGGAWSSWQPFSAAALWQLPVASGQTATVEAQFQDRAGNPSATYSDAIPLNLYPARPASSGYTLVRSTFGVSGGQAGSTGYKLGGTWGQPSAVSGMSSAGYRAQWGYWQAATTTPPPQAAFTGSPTSGVAPLAVSFTNGSSNYTSSLWAFGDGQTSTVASPSHTYATAGSYTVSLKATGPGGTNTFTRTNYIVVTTPATPPQAAFTGSPTSGVAPLAVNFTNGSSNYTSSLWNFGDGQSSTAASPAHSYANPGSYTVSLKVTGPGGTNTFTRTNYIVVTAPPTNGPVLSIPANIPAAVGQPVQVPLQFTPNGATIASTVFSIDYDHACLTFDPTDSDGDGVPNAVSFNLPAAFAGGVVFNSADTASELDFTIIDSLPPLSSLPGQTVATLTFVPKAACQPTAGNTRAVAVNFAAQPAVSFGSSGGGSVAGSAINGSVQLGGALPGDANGDGKVDAGDLTALVLEIFDGDGDLPGNVPGGTFPGFPGADANRDNVVNAGDLTCTVLLIFGRTCTGATALDVEPLAGPSLTLPSQIAARPGETVTVPVQFAANGNSISSLVFSLDIDPTWLTFDPADANADGLPDAVQVSLPVGFDVSVMYDPTDIDGEVDISILDPLAPLAILTDGQLMSLTFTAGTPDAATETALGFSTNPPLSFGSAGGGSITGSGTAGSVLIEPQPHVYLPLIIK